MSPEIIPIKQAPAVTNTAQLGRGTGARYLECMRAHRPELPLIAIRWRRTIPPKYEVLIDYEPETIR